MERRNFLGMAISGLPVLSKPKTGLFVSRPKKGIKVQDKANRLQQPLKIGHAEIDCKVSTHDTEGDLFVFVSSNNLKSEGVPAHIHPNQDETFFVIEGQVKIKVGEETFYLNQGDHLLAPRNIPHSWVCNSEHPAKLLITAQPAGKMEAFFLTLSKVQQLNPELAARIYKEHDMQLVGPPMLAD